MRSNQRVSPQRGSLPGQQSRMLSNRMFLLRLLWEQQNVENDYQAVFEEYFNFLDQKALQIQIEEEIKLMKSKKSFAIVLKDLSYNRAIVLEELHSQIEQIQSSKIKTEHDINSICQSLQKLRQADLVFAENLLAVHHYFTQKIKSFKNYTELGPFFMALNEDNHYLKKSLLRKYIVFSSSYDPFLLKHYELLKKTNNPRLKELPCIQRLFTIPSNEIYRLNKTNQEIKLYLQQTKFEADMKQTISKEKNINDFNKIKHSYRGIQPKEKIVNNVYLGSRSIKSGSNSPHSDQKNGFTKETNFSNYFSERRYTEKEGNLLPRIKTIGITDQEQISVIKNNNRSGLSYHSIGSPESRKRYFDRKVQMVSQKEAEFKKYVFPKRFRDRNSTGMSNKNKQVPKKDSNYLSSKVYFTQRSNNTEPIKSKNIEVQCELGWNQNRKKSLGGLDNEQVQENKKNFRYIEEDNEEKISNQKRKKRTKIVTQQEDAVAKKSSVIFAEDEKPQIKKKKMQTQQIPEDSQKVQTKKPKTKQKKTQPQEPTKKQQNSATKEKSKKKLQQKQPTISQKKYRLKASDKNDTPEDIFKILKKLEIKPEYRRNFQVGNWEKSIIYNQYYFHKSFINDELQAISLSCALPQGDITVKYWGPLQSCDQQMSNFLFSKYLEHLQKSTHLKSIYFNANFIKELAANNFIQKKQRIYQRMRAHSEKIQENDYTYFLSVNFTNVALNKLAPNQNEFILQSCVKQFETHKFIIFNYLLIINKLMYPGSFASIASYHSKLKSIQKLHQVLLSKYQSRQAYNQNFQCQDFNILTLKIQTPIFSAFFVADKGFIKVVGQVIYSDSETFIVCLPMLKYNAKMYFGKGIKNATDMVQKVKENSNKNNYERVQFSIRMFKKRLRGKVWSITLKDENCYGDLQINFAWKDYLKGKIVHSMTDCEQIFNEAFYCQIEMEKEMMFVFEVLPEEFVSY